MTRVRPNSASDRYHSTSDTVCPIHREAREAAERAIAALRDLGDEDPYVFRALITLQFGKKSLQPRSAREQMRRVRELAHELKQRAASIIAGVAEPAEGQEVRFE